ncbi:uncharacterized protein LOC117137684 [Drosophila mauritiana]|uniref:Uncharacterized protein LOC117137684 n=1 Tax=Drosophila mauritiana TaxID=7226 RepID=A0A6P8JHF4_DROMA|nr:uncharacterized protein LOC117137684 [Drosophila mauritiana]
MIMLVATLQPEYVPVGITPLLNWTEPSSLKHCDEDYLIVVLALSMCTQFLLMTYVGFAIMQPCSMRRKQLIQSQQRTFANFIFRRLLFQLDEALHPSLGAERLDCCLRSSEKVIQAIQLFRRDALKVLQPVHNLSSALASDFYYVLDEEEDELDSNGYGCSHSKVEVTEELLVCLLYPERKVSGKK